MGELKISKEEPVAPEATGESSDKTGTSVLRYPENIGSEESGKTYIRFHIVDRLSLDEKKSIFLYAPPGLAVTDGAGYHQLDLGTIGGMIEKFSANRAEGQGFWEATAGTFTGADMKAVGKLMVGEIGKGMGQRMLMKEGIARNPFSVQQFSGVTARSFNFSFKLVAESSDQGKTLKEIENTFRKFLYPSNVGSELQLKYPPYWKIQFWQGKDHNKHLPFINLSYLQNMTATYNQSTNAFHKDGRPLEVDISLTFQESKNMTREDLYIDSDEAEYTYDYSANVLNTDLETDATAIVKKVLPI